MNKYCTQLQNIERNDAEVVLLGNLFFMFVIVIARTCLTNFFNGTKHNAAQLKC